MKNRPHGSHSGISSTVTRNQCRCGTLHILDIFPPIKYESTSLVLDFRPSILGLLVTCPPCALGVRLCLRLRLWHSRVLTNSMSLEGTARFRRYAIDMHRAVTALGGDIFIEGVPCHTLDIVRVFCYFMDTFSIDSSEDSCYVVCTPSNDIFTSGTPC